MRASLDLVGENVMGRVIEHETIVQVADQEVLKGPSDLVRPPGQTRAHQGAQPIIKWSSPEHTKGPMGCTSSGTVRVGCGPSGADP